MEFSPLFQYWKYFCLAATPMKSHHAIFAGSTGSILVLLVVSFHRSALYDQEMAAKQRISQLEVRVCCSIHRFIHPTGMMINDDRQ